MKPVRATVEVLAILAFVFAVAWLAAVALDAAEDAWGLLAIPAAAAVLGWFVWLIH
jgi:hypothetical protein